jgi:hypothetical protein
VIFPERKTGNTRGIAVAQPLTENDVIALVRRLLETLPHGDTHEDGGSDEIDVTGLSGLLADPQTPAAHTHIPTEVGFPTLIPNAVFVTDSSGQPALVDASSALDGDALLKLDSVDPKFEWAKPSGGGGGGATFGTATIDFGAAPGSQEAIVAVADPGVSATSKVECFFMASDSTADHTMNDHRYAALLIACTAGDLSAGVGFTIFARSLDKTQGTFKVRWKWS